MEEHFHIANLIVRKIKEELSSEDEVTLQNWINEKEENSDLFEKIISNEHLLNKLETYQIFDSKKTWSSIENDLFETKIIKLKTRRFLSYAASIIIPLLMIGSLTYYFLVFSQQTLLSKIDQVIKPGEQRAMLVLSNDEIVNIESEKSKITINQGGTQVVNQNGSLTYATQNTIVHSQELVYNKLVTPKGGSYNLKLSDGTMVWLNAASSIKFPVAFTDDSIRQVFIEGEAFFDVSHSIKPFIVESQNMKIQVLGTSFNVSTYSNEPNAKTTLVEGSIKLFANNVEKMLLPNQQATVSHENTHLTIRDVDTKPYTSWVHGKMEFNYDDLDAVMRRLARWYDFEYSFKNDSAKQYHFTGSIDNTEGISSILKMLEMTTDVTFDMNENTIIIL